MATNEELRQQAATLLGVIWRGIPREYKSRYRRTIWQQFEDRVRAAAYTGTLATFATRLCTSLEAALGRTDAERVCAADVIQAGADRALLRLLREETTTLVLLVQLDTDARKAEWAAAAMEPGETAEEETDAHV